LGFGSCSRKSRKIVVYDRPLTIEENLTLLAATPSRLADLTKGLTPPQLVTPPEPGEWSRKATVTGAGKPLERTVRTYAMWLANHERSHFKQIERIASSLRT
jgi:hypothetical protein